MKMTSYNVFGNSFMDNLYANPDEARELLGNPEKVKKEFIDDPNYEDKFYKNPRFVKDFFNKIENYEEMYFVDSNDMGYLYKILRNGRVLQFDIFEGIWSDVTRDVNITYSWMSCSDSFVNYVFVCSYNFKNLNFWSKIKPQYQPKGFSEGFSLQVARKFYYGKPEVFPCGNFVFMIDEFDNLAICGKNYMLSLEMWERLYQWPINLTIEDVTSTCKVLGINSVMDAINSVNGILFDTDNLYYDKNKDIVIFDYSQREFKYIVDKDEIIAIFDDQDKDEKLIKYEGDERLELFDKKMKFFSMTDEEYENQKSLYEFLKMKNKNNVFSDFYTDEFFRVFAMDENGNEYIYSPSGFKPFSKDSEFIKYPLKRKDVIDAIEFYDLHKKMQQNSDNVVVADLKIFESEYFGYFGITEDGREFCFSDCNGKLTEVEPHSYSSYKHQLFQGYKMEMLILPLFIRDLEKAAKEAKDSNY